MNGIENYCLVPGTKIFIAWGTVKNIEDVKIGDIVIDVFGKETKVINTFTFVPEI